MAEPNITALRAFVAVAEQLHFTRAAQSLHMTTPALSQQVHRLEALLGTSLFARSSRRVELTAEGRDLLPLAQEAINVHDRIRHWSSRAQEAVVRVGFVHVGAPELLSEVFAAVPERLAGTRLEFRHVTRDGIASALRDGEVDVVFSWGPNWLDGVATRTLTTARRVVLLHAGSDAGLSDPTSLSDSDGGETSVAQLSAATFLVPEATDDRYISWALVDPRPDGGRPRRGPQVRNLEEAFAMVATGLGVHLVPEPVALATHHPGVSWAAVTDIPGAPFNMSLLQRPASTLLGRFAGLVDEYFPTGSTAS
ncbi:LysR family transcriptional regulator [Kocuria sp. LHG3120]|uniref:LysR family transcriptional regulator n=1 Tax=Kocuria sp. LHG3120 TaxID=2804590 RepID=UPI003CF1183F